MSRKGPTAPVTTSREAAWRPCRRDAARPWGFEASLRIPALAHFEWSIAEDATRGHIAFHQFARRDEHDR